jgi:high affinity Mn2+ porin
MKSDIHQQRKSSDRPARFSAARPVPFQFVAVAIILAGACTVNRRACFATGAGDDSTEHAESKIPPDDEFERRELERQRQVIDQKLAAIAARHKGPKGTATSTTPENEKSPVVEGRNDSSKSSTPAAPPSEAPPESIPAKNDVEQFSVHGQATVITQKHDAFHSPYSGANSLPRHEGEKTSVTATLFLGLRLPWKGASAYFDPEVAGGEGFGGVTGLAGFSNGEIPRVGSPEPRPYVARLYFQQVFDLGGEQKHVESDQNQLAGYQPENRLTLTVGKFGAVDFFDGNAFSHDPRAQFINWSIMEQGAWDYPADTRGYTEGFVVEYNEPKWAVRYGAFAEPTKANGGTLDEHVPRRLGHVLELEERHSLWGRPGEVRLLGFLNSAHMGSYSEALRLSTGPTPDVTATRSDRIKYGFGIEAEQAISDDFGIFGRLGWNDGHTESWAYTEIDRSVSAGLSLKGTRWQRPDDVVGLAGVLNGISKDHRDYLATGGYGFLIGDGRLPHYGSEKIVEGYYLFKVSDRLFVTGDLQFVLDPAYNRDRGPVFIGGLRVHAAF